MINKTNRIYRRDFLKVGGAGLAALASAPLWADLPADTRSKPVDPVVLRSSSLEVILDRMDGLPYEYRLLTADVRMRGEDFGGKIGVALCRLAQPLQRKDTVNIRADLSSVVAHVRQPQSIQRSVVRNFVGSFCGP